ncbi:hypothetical protein U1Q18_044846 [Sarracenia purpurea var. burkii]
MQIARRAHRAEHSFRADDTVNEPWTTQIAPIIFSLLLTLTKLDPRGKREVPLRGRRPCAVLFDLAKRSLSTVSPRPYPALIATIATASHREHPPQSQPQAMDGSPTEEDLPQTQLATMVDNFTPGNGTQGQPAATADDLTQEDPPQGQPAATADDLTQEDPPQGQPATTDDDLLCRDLLDYIYNIICVKVVEALQHSDDHRVALVLWSDHRPYSAARIEIIQAVNRGILRLLASATTHIPGLEFQIGPAHFETEFATAIEKVERIIAGWPDVAFVCQ